MFIKFLYTKELEQCNIRELNIYPFPLHFACVVGNILYSPNNPICQSMSLASVVVINMTIYHQFKYIPYKLLHIKISRTLNEKQNTVFSPVYNLSLHSVVFSSFLLKSSHYVECLISRGKCSAFPVLNVSRVARLVELGMFVYMLGLFRPTRAFFTYLETSPLPVKDCKFWPILGTYGHWVVRVLKCDTGHLFIMVISEDPWHSHLMPSVWQWSCHYLF